MRSSTWASPWCARTGCPRRSHYLDRVGKMETRDEELLSLRDKANLALGFAYLQAQRPADARPILERVRLEGPFSSMALLGVGWADSALGEFKRALVPWLALRKRNLLDSAVQESYLTVPYAYNQLGAPGQAAEYYSSAIDSFDAEFKRIDESIEQIRGGRPARSAAERRQEGHAHLVLAAEDAARRAGVALPVPAARQQRVPGGPEELPRAQVHEPQYRRLARERCGLRQHARYPAAGLRRGGAESRRRDGGAPISTR